MAFRGYILIEAEVGLAKQVANAVAALEHAEAKVVSVDTVTGPFDVIAQMEADDLDGLGRALSDGVQRIEGVQRTTTCLAVRLG